MNRLVTATTLLCLFMLPAFVVQAQEPLEPSAEHKILHREAGTWDASMKMFNPGTDEVAEESKGVEVNEVVCNGLWLRSHFKGEFMGMQFEGIGMTSYDADKKHYFGYWGDNMSPAPSTMEGEYDEDSTTFTYTVIGKGPSGEETEAKHVIEYKDDNNRVFTMYMGDMKIMEITYEKRAEEGSNSK